MSSKTKVAPRFFVDAMLGNIAKKLRLLGYDTRYLSDIRDSELVEIAKKENRIIVSKDEQLTKTSVGKTQSILLSNNSEKDQLIEIFTICGQRVLEISGDTARCPKCNFQTHPVNKSIISKQVPSKVLEFNNKFWRCENCDQIYWEGTHIKNLKQVVDEINEKL